MDSDQNILDPLDHRITNYTPEKHQANHGKRIINSIVDKIIVLALGVLFLVIMVNALNFVFKGRSRVFHSEEAVWSWFSFMIATAHFTYYIILESVFGRTLGKLITNTKVVDPRGETPYISIIFKRTLSRLVPLDALSFMGELPRGWHDEWSNTYVVNRK